MNIDQSISKLGGPKWHCVEKKKKKNNEKSILKVLLISVCLEVTRMWYILYDENVF